MKTQIITSMLSLSFLITNGCAQTADDKPQPETPKAPNSPRMDPGLRPPTSGKAVIEQEDPSKLPSNSERLELTVPEIHDELASVVVALVKQVQAHSVRFEDRGSIEQLERFVQSWLGGDGYAAGQPAEQVNQLRIVEEDTTDEGESIWDDLSQELVELLQVDLLNQKNLVSIDEQRAVFQLNPNVFCRQIEDQGTSGDEGELDEVCATFLKNLTPELSVSQDERDGLTIKLLVGASKNMVLELKIRDGEVSAQLDLASLRIVLLEMHQLDSESMPLTKLAQGRVNLNLSWTPSSRLEIALGMRDGGQISLGDERGEWKAKVSPSARLWTLRSDLSTESLETSVDLNSVDLQVPWSFASDLFDLAPEAEFSSVGAHLERFGFAGTYQFGASKVQLMNLNMGDEPLTLSVDGTKRVSLKLSGVADRMIDLVLGNHMGQKQAYLKWVHGAQLRGELELQGLGSALGDDFLEAFDGDAGAIDGEYQVTLAGEEPKFVALPTSEGRNGALLLQGGALSLTGPGTRSEISAGQCLTLREVELPENPLVGQVQGVECPG